MRNPPSVDANRSACGCTSPQPGTSTPSTHHGWGGLRLVWKNSSGEKRKWRRRTASIVSHFVYQRGMMMMDWRVNTVNASQPSTRAPSEHHWWVCTCSIWANSMIGMRKLSGCQCRNMWQLTGGKGMYLLDLGQFNDWNEKIEWLSMQKYVTINWWEGVVG